MGTDFVENRTAAGLFNCAYRSTKDLQRKGGYLFQWMMDALMVGIGVGFDTLGEGSVEIKKPGSVEDKIIPIVDPENTYLFENGVHTCVIADTREGWVEALRVLLDAFYFGYAAPVFDYSLIRKKGALIKGFGGTASGHGPLKDMLDTLAEMYTKSIGQKITEAEIVDTQNLIGRCVVAGNVRRSAALAMGKAESEEFLKLKDPTQVHEWEAELAELGPRERAIFYTMGSKEKIAQEQLEWEQRRDRRAELKNLIANHPLRHHRWGSNNSIDVSGTEDYTRHAELTVKNGEPGYIWLENARHFGRIKDGERDDDLQVMGFNPCFGKDTLIAVADGRGAVSIEQLATEGRDVPVYSIDPNTGMVSIKYGRNPRLTGTDKKLIKIILDDGTSLKVTPDHKFYLLDGTAILAKDLMPGDSLPKLTKRLEQISNKDPNSKYLRINTNTRDCTKDKVFEHRLIAKFFHEEEFNNIYDESKQSGWIRGGLAIHHVDFNKLNNSPENLKCMNWADHCAIHARNMHGENNPMYGKTHSAQTKAKIGSKSTARWSTEEFKKKQQETWASDRRANASKTMSCTRKQELHNYYVEEEANTTLKTIWDKGHLKAIKTCETCNVVFVVNWAKRGSTYCSTSCANKKESSIAARAKGQKQTFESKQRTTLHNQIQVFKDLKEALGRNPLKKEWEKLCAEKGVPKRFRTGSDNPYTLKGFKDLSARSADYNHRVKSIEELEGVHNVYNISVEDNHTVGIPTSYDSKTGAMSGIFVAQCVEQQLEDAELCCLVETYPWLHESYEDYLITLKIAYLYAKTVTLAKTQWPETNAIMLKNRRIGLSMSGFIQACNIHGINTMYSWCDNAYEYVQNLDKVYSDWLCVPQSKRKTSIKPSGTVSKLNGSWPGIHHPEAEYYIQRIRFADDSDMLPQLVAAGYHTEPDAYSPNTTVVSFPIHEKLFERGKAEISMWEQLEIAAQMQYYWADNSVSVTVTFKPEEAASIPYALTLYSKRLKAVSFLQYKDTGYVQAPWEPITKEKYEQMYNACTPINKLETLSQGAGERFCTTDKCEIDFSKLDKS